MKFSHYLSYKRDERIALLFLVFLMVVAQLVYRFADFSSVIKSSDEETEWLALQTEIDSLKKNSSINGYKMYPFNPNFISDYKGYKLGMSVAEIDRLLQYRNAGKFVNSPEEFQKVTKVSNLLLKKIAPYFKFPEWVNKKNDKIVFTHKEENSIKKEKIVVQDINQASKEDLMKVYGIGEVISDRILKNRAALGGFVSMDQIHDIWGLSPDVVAELLKRFEVFKIPSITKTDVNAASTKELLKIPYLRYAIAREIITYRSMHGEIKSVDDLLKIKGFPVEKVKIIALYLEF